jgi:arginine decarboxylase
MISSESDWDTNRALQTYQIHRWGGGYFNVNEKGNISVHPIQGEGASLDLREVVEEATKSGLSFPMLIRFQDLLRHRVKRLNEAFREAIAEEKYEGEYRGVFPIKVNQLREVVEEILDAGAPYHYGIEAGSKPELYAALAMHTDNESLLICNGFKDRNFIETALIGCRLGKKVIMVVEKIEELHSIIAVSREMGVQPFIGMRVRLSTKSEGKWATSGGEDAKFGLSTTELVEATDLLKKHGMESSFQLLHFHIGSQIPDILAVKRAVREATRYYAKLRQLGFPLEYIDCGGGLGIDYDGTRSTKEISMNYTLAEYARDVVDSIAKVCNEEKVSHPHIVTESGRAIVAHHSVLIVNVFGAIEKTPLVPAPEDYAKAHKLVHDLLEVKAGLKKGKRRECLHDAQQIKEDTQARFDLGLLDLKSKAQVETLYWEVVERVVELYHGAKNVPLEIQQLRASLGDQFLCNFSIFQSLIDHWALGMIFPIAPIHRLNEKPIHQGTLVDITCDSDGKIDDFIVGEEGTLQHALPLHHMNGEPYFLGIFLMGAYQDIMGDLHNLFGRVNEAHVFLDADEPSGFYIEETIAGFSISEVLATVQYDANLIARAMKAQVDAAIKSDRLKPSEGMRLLEAYEQGLKGSTYLQALATL